MSSRWCWAGRDHAAVLLASHRWWSRAAVFATRSFAAENLEETAKLVFLTNRRQCADWMHGLSLNSINVDKSEMSDSRRTLLTGGGRSPRSIGRDAFSDLAKIVPGRSNSSPIFHGREEIAFRKVGGNHGPRQLSRTLGLGRGRLRPSDEFAQTSSEDRTNHIQT